MRKILHFFVIISLLFSCNNDSSNDDNLTKTLLETLDGTQWENGEMGNWQMFYNFKNDLNNPIISWEGYFNSTSCVQYYETSDYPNFEILQNSETIFEIKETEQGSVYIYTFRRSGETLLAHYYSDELGTIYERDFVFVESTLDLTQFEKC